MQMATLEDLSKGLSEIEASSTSYTFNTIDNGETAYLSSLIDGTRRAFLDDPWQFQVIVRHVQAPQAVGLHRAVGVVGVRLLRAAHRHLAQPVRADHKEAYPGKH
jgi:hypothetical protein